MNIGDFMKNYIIKDKDILKIHDEYRNKFIKYFKDEYRISDRKFEELAKELEKNKYQLTYELLSNKANRIFDKTSQNEIIVSYTENEIQDLIEIIKCNNISCNYKDMVSYRWAKFDKNTIRELGNSIPMNQSCPVFSFNEFISLFGF